MIDLGRDAIRIVRTWSSDLAANKRSRGEALVKRVAMMMSR